MRRILLILCRANIRAESPDHPWPASGGPIAIDLIAGAKRRNLWRSADTPMVQR
jgi:hypothetical protein